MGMGIGRLLFAIGIAAGARGAGAAAPAFPLIDGLGQHRRPVTHCSPLAQRYFDQAMAFRDGFNRSCALKSLAVAEGLSPDCPMIHWAIALTYGPDINSPDLTPPHAAAAWREWNEARALAPSASPVERALIAALGRRYAEPSPADRKPLDRAYADAMRTVWREYPADGDVGAWFAEALMDLRPWDQWTADGRPEPGTAEVLATLEAVMRIDPRHPYANHLYIHAVEASPHPERALPEADRLEGLQPMLAHNVHMPSHIYIRVGRWQEAIDVNLAAVAAQRRLEALVGPPRASLALYNAHNEHMLAYAAMMTGQSALAGTHIRAALACLPPELWREDPVDVDYFESMPLEVRVRFGRWAEILAAPPPADPAHPYTRAFARAARAVAAAALGRIALARAEQTAYRAAAEQVPAAEPFGLNSARAVLAVVSPMVEGEIDVKSGQAAAGIGALRRAVAAEDALRYDEPPGWLIPVRQSLGAALLHQGRLAEAEAVYRADLARLPRNGWSLFGLAQTLAQEGRAPEAAAVLSEFRAVWARADIAIGASCLCQAP